MAISRSKPKAIPKKPKPVASSPLKSSTSNTTAKPSVSANEIKPEALEKPKVDAAVQKASRRAAAADVGAQTLATNLQNALPADTAATPLSNAEVTQKGMRNIYTPAESSTMEGIKAGEAGELVRGHKGAG